MDPFTIAAIAGVVGKLFGAKAAKSRANKQEQLDEQQHNDDVSQWLQEQSAKEQDRQQKISLYTAFAKGNNLDSALTPEMMDMLRKPKPVIQPPAYRKAGTPGFGWDLAGIAAQGASSIYGANKASKLNLSDIIKKARLGVYGGASTNTPGYSLPR